MKTKGIHSVSPVAFVAAILVLVLISAACKNNTVFTERKQLERNTWSMNDTLYYQFHVTDTLSPVNIFFNVRNTTDYKYQNLYIFLTAYYPGNKFSRDTIDITLAEPDGKWLGKRSGIHRDISVLFRKNIIFNKPGIYTLAVNQAMRTEKLEGISDFGIRIDKTKAEK